MPEERNVILDAFATTGTKRFLNIEMQKAEHDFFIDRTVLYKAFQIIKGKQEMENSDEFKTLTKEQKVYRRYEIPECVSIWICDFELSQTKGNYIDEWATYSRESLKSGTFNTIFTKNRYIMVNLPRFNKTVDEIVNPIDVWLYVLKHASDGKELPNFGSSIVSEALNRIRIDNLDKNTLNELEREMTTKEEMECCIAFAKVKAKESADRYVAETKLKIQLELVDAMLASPKFTDEDIATISRIPLEEIQKRRTTR